MIAICRVEPDGTYVELCRLSESDAQVTVPQRAMQDVEQPPGFEGVGLPGRIGWKNGLNMVSNDTKVNAWFLENWGAGKCLATMKPKVTDFRGEKDSNRISSLDNNIFAHLDTVPREGINQLCKELNISNIKAELTVYGYKYILYRVYAEGFK